MALTVRPATLREANAFVASVHRHHKPARGCRFCLKAVDADGATRAVLIASRPVARMLDPERVCEVVRLASDGTPNACSILYGAAARAARSMGFERIQTYTLPEEGGASLRASGWSESHTSSGGTWNRNSGVRTGRREDQPLTAKTCWVREFGGTHG